MKSLNTKTENLDINANNEDFVMEMDLSSDLLAEEILENMNSTPLGQILKRIASLPEVRQKKVLNLRQQICAGSYNENQYIDNVLEKVFEEI